MTRRQHAFRRLSAILQRVVYCLASCAMLLTLCGCGEYAKDDRKRAPFHDTYAGLRLSVPVRLDLHQATAFEAVMMVTICYRSGNALVPLCEELSAPLVNENGVTTFIRQPIIGTNFKLLKERNPALGPPEAAPLIAIPDQLIYTDLLAAGSEAYYLERLSGYKGRLYTTSQGWPTAGCRRSVEGQQFCVLGFLIRGAPIEVSFFPERGTGDLKQRDIWTIAKAIEDKFLALAN